MAQSTAQPETHSPSIPHGFPERFGLGLSPLDTLKAQGRAMRKELKQKRLANQDRNAVRVTQQIRDSAESRSGTQHRCSTESCADVFGFDEKLLQASNRKAFESPISRNDEEQSYHYKSSSFDATQGFDLQANTTRSLNYSVSRSSSNYGDDLPLISNRSSRSSSVPTVTVKPVIEHKQKTYPGDTNDAHIDEQRHGSMYFDSTQESDVRQISKERNVSFSSPPVNREMLSPTTKDSRSLQSGFNHSFDSNPRMASASYSNATSPASSTHSTPGLASTSEVAVSSSASTYSHRSFNFSRPRAHHSQNVQDASDVPEQASRRVVTGDKRRELSERQNSVDEVSRHRRLGSDPKSRDPILSDRMTELNIRQRQGSEGFDTPRRQMLNATSDYDRKPTTPLGPARSPTFHSESRPTSKRSAQSYRTVDPDSPLNFSKQEARFEKARSPQPNSIRPSTPRSQSSNPKTQSHFPLSHSRVASLPDASLSADEHVDLGIEQHELDMLPQSTHHFRVAALQGDLSGCFLYGLALRHGWGTRVNLEESVRMLQKAADGDEGARKPTRMSMTMSSKLADRLSAAIYELGVSFKNGWGVTKDLKKALKYIEMAAEMEDGDALMEAATCYLTGQGCKKDKRKAAQFMRRAEKKGVSEPGNSWIWKDKYN